MTQVANYINWTEETAKPQIGMGATHLGWTDRTPYTIISISKSGKSFVMQEDKSTRTDKNGMSDAQSYTHESNPEGRTREVRMTKRGWRIGGVRGDKVLVGVRTRYYDYSF